jgi:hypothetical protein
MLCIESMAVVPTQPLLSASNITLVSTLLIHIVFMGNLMCVVLRALSSVLSLNIFVIIFNWYLILTVREARIKK